MSFSAHHYISDVVPLLDDCIGNLQRTIDQDLSGSHSALYEMKDVLVSTERILHQYLLQILETEQQQQQQQSLPHQQSSSSSPVSPPLGEVTNIINENHNNNHRFTTAAAADRHDTTTTTTTATAVGSNNSRNCNIMDTLAKLKHVLEATKEQKQEDHHRTTTECRRHKFLKNPQDPAPNERLQSRPASITTTNNSVRRQTTPYYSSRSVTDSLLFRLIVALQLCLVRIDDAHFVITGRRISTTQPTKGGAAGVVAVGETNHHGDRLSFLLTGCCCCVLGAGIAVFAVGAGGGGDDQGQNRRSILRSLTVSRGSSSSSSSRRQQLDKTSLMKLVAEGGIAIAVGKWLHSTWKRLWMTDKIVRSTNEIDDWLTQWQMVQEYSSSSQPFRPTTTTTTTSTAIDASNQLSQHEADEEEVTPQKDDILDATSSRLNEYTMKNGPRSYIWQTQGEIRFLMLKRFMDVYYASVGTAIDNTQQSSWQFSLVTGAAAASFYSLTGASEKASQVVNTASKDLIQNAWGMVSLPAIKNLMLQASRLLKGASVADRVEICGISCFILSRDPAPELAAAIKRQDSNRKKAVISTMSTISELDEDHVVSQPKLQKKFAGLSGRYRQRDVIFHLTGGGFFAHTIASDLPYLLDWSASTGAVVICPEYALLPEHTWPVALEQVSEVYSALIDGEAVIDLGFEVNKIVVTGESAGGNLATALCVKLGMQKLLDQDSLDVTEEIANNDSFDCRSTETLYDKPTRLPDALMLSCPALNLSLEITQSRVLGMQDPVLPKGLISAISDAYLPQGMNKMDPLASPFFASDAVLRLFPPVLMFAGSNDPLLDDSVTLNERLRCLDVDSELRVAHNMPHAYWGLGTAGFPEAQQVQQECQEWLTRQLDSSYFSSGSRIQSS